VFLPVDMPVARSTPGMRKDAEGLSGTVELQLCRGRSLRFGKDIDISQTFCPCRARVCRLVSMASVFRADRSLRVYRGTGERQGRAHCRTPWRSHCHSRMDVGSRCLRRVQSGQPSGIRGCAD
jgi:hypothetical protein